MDFALAVPDFLGPAAATRLVVPRESATLTGRPLRAACACLADFLALAIFSCVAGMSGRYGAELPWRGTKSVAPAPTRWAPLMLLTCFS